MRQFPLVLGICLLSIASGCIKPFEFDTSGEERQAMMIDLNINFSTITNTEPKWWKE